MSHKARNMVRSLQIAAAFAPVLLVSGAGAQGLTEQQQFARGIYQELVEINTTTATGDTQKAAEAMGARLRAAGFPEGDGHVFSPAPPSCTRSPWRVLTCSTACGATSTS